MDPDTKLLNKLLKTKLLLSKEICTYPANCNLIQLLIKLVNNNYVFTVLQIDNFITQACTNNKHSECFIGSKVKEHKLIIEYIFKNCTITEEHLDKITKIYICSMTLYIDILFNKKCDFSLLSYSYLCDADYKCPKIGNYNELHSNVIYAICMHIFALPSDKKFNLCLNLLKLNGNPFNIDHFKLVLICATEYYNIKRINHLTIFLNELLVNVNTNEIFQAIIDHNGSTHNMSYNNVLNYVINKYECNDLFANYLCNDIAVYEPEYLIKLIVKKHPITLEILNNILNNYVNPCFTVVYQEAYKALIPKNILKTYLIDNGYIHFMMLDLFDIVDVKPNYDTLNIICGKDIYVNDVCTFIEKYKLIPDKKTLDICIKSLNHILINSILNYKITPDEETFDKLKSLGYFDQTHIKIVELLINHGLEINLKHVIYFLSIDTYLTNLERFDIKYDEHLYFICYINDNWPSEYINKFTIDKTVLMMHKLCMTKKLMYNKLLQFLVTNKIKLDRYALDFLIFHNCFVAEEIMENYKCLPNILTTFKYCEIPIENYLSIVAEQYNIGSVDMLKQYDIAL